MMLLVVNTSCNKETTAVYSGSTPINPPPPPPNRPPVANAGNNLSVALFKTEMTLRGQVSDPDINNTHSFNWTGITAIAIPYQRT